MALVAALLEILEKPSFGEVLLELVMFMGPIWIAVVVGVLVGWVWKPKWAKLGPDSFDSRDVSASSSSGMLLQNLSSGFASISSLKLQLPTCIPWIKEAQSPPSISCSSSSSSELEGEKSVVTETDLLYLDGLVEESDGGPAWIQMMDRSTSNMSYQAWRRDPEVHFSSSWPCMLCAFNLTMLHLIG